MHDSGRVLREKIQIVLGQISRTSHREEKPQSCTRGDVSTGAVTPVVETCSPASTGRIKSVDEILSLIDLQSRRSIAPPKEGPTKAELELALERSEIAREEAVWELAHVSSQNKEQGEKFRRHAEISEAKNVEKIQSLIAENEALVHAKTDLEDKLGNKIGRNDELMKSHIEREKQTILAKERSQRKKWEEKKLVEIKEQTMRGLEPEIERILSTHKAEKKIMIEQHSQAVELLRSQHVLEMRTALHEMEKKATDQLLVDLDNERNLFRKKDVETFNSFLKQLEEERERGRLRSDTLVLQVREEAQAQLLQERDKHQLVIQAFDERTRSEVERKEADLMMEYSKLLDQASAQQKTDSASIHRLEEELANSSVRLDEAQRTISKLRDDKTNLERLEQEQADLTDRVGKLEMNLEQVTFEKNNLAELLKIAENDFQVFKLTELARIEASVTRLVETKNREIGELMERVEEYEVRRQT